jgi:DNA-binding MarR family transcriptional regulator
VIFLLKDLPDQQVLQNFALRYPEMDIAATEACLCLLKAASTLMLKLEKQFAQYGLSQARFLALIVLVREESGTLRPVDVAEKMGVSLKNTMRLLAAMEQDQLIQRIAHKTDKRASLVLATETGKQLLSQVLPGYYRLMNQITSSFNIEEKQILIEQIKRLDLGVSTVD